MLQVHVSWCSTTGCLLALQATDCLVEDGFEEGKVTGAVFIDLSAAYHTVNHRCLLHKILELTRDIHLTELIESMLENRFFFAELGSKKSRWRRLKNGLPQESVLTPLLQHLSYLYQWPTKKRRHTPIHVCRWPRCSCTG